MCSLHFFDRARPSVVGQECNLFVTKKRHTFGEITSATLEIFKWVVNVANT